MRGGRASLEFEEELLAREDECKGEVERLRAPTREIALKYAAPSRQDGYVYAHTNLRTNARD